MVYQKDKKVLSIADNDDSTLDHTVEGTVSIFKECALCNCIKIEDPDHHLYVHHCSTCGVCVLGMDHHCTFINNCVGKGSIKAFVLFQLWVVPITVPLWFCYRQYIQDNNLSYHLPYTTVYGLVLNSMDYFTIWVKWPLVSLFIDNNDGEFNGWTRPSFRMTPIDYTSGKYPILGEYLSNALSGDYVYPEGVPPGDYYFIDTILFMFNLFWMFASVIA